MISGLIDPELLKISEKPACVKHAGFSIYNNTRMS